MTTNPLEMNIQENLSYIRDNAKLTVDKILGANPTREQLGDFLAEIANHYVLEVNQTAIWDLVNETHKFNVTEFEDDSKETIKKYGLESVEMYGIRNWKFKG